MDMFTAENTMTMGAIHGVTLNQDEITQINEEWLEHVEWHDLVEDTADYYDHLCGFVNSLLTVHY